MLPLKGWSDDGSRTFADHEIDGLGARVFDIGSRRVEVRVVRNGEARAADRRKQRSSPPPALMGRDHVLEREQILHARRWKRNHEGEPA